MNGSLFGPLIIWFLNYEFALSIRNIGRNSTERITLVKSELAYYNDTTIKLVFKLARSLHGNIVEISFIIKIKAQQRMR